MPRSKHPVSKKRAGRTSEQASPSSAGPRSSSSGRTTRQKEAPQTPGSTIKRKKHRFKPGTVALREICHLQKTWNHLIPAAAFIRVVKEISNQLAPQITRWQAEALVAMQEAAEEFLVHLFQDAMLCGIHAKRVTLSESLFVWIECFYIIILWIQPVLFFVIVKKDFELARRIGGQGGQGGPW